MKIKKSASFFFLIAFCALSGTWAQKTAPSAGVSPGTKPFWQQAIGGAVIAPPTSQARSVVMISDGGNIKAYSWEGILLWNYFARGRLQPFITRSREGTTYVCRTNGTLIAVNRAGRELWRISLGEPLAAPIMIGWDGRLFVFTARHIRCYTASGFSLWSKPLEKAIAVNPCHDGQGGFFLVLEDGEFLRISAFGEALSYPLESIPSAAVPFKSEEDNFILLFYPSGLAELFNILDGNREGLPEITLAGSPAAATAWGSGAAVLLADGRISCFSVAGREILWTGETHLSPGDFSDSPLEVNFFADERGIFCLTRTGAAGFTEDGRRLWLIRLQGTAGLPAFGDEGVLYSGGADWILYAYKLEDRARFQEYLLYGPAPDGLYGIGIPRPDFWTSYYFRYSEDELKLWFNEIESAVSKGEVGAKEKDYAFWLMEIAGSSLQFAHLDNSVPELHPPVFVPQRARAIRLLSYIGSRETVPFLTEIFLRDKDPVIKAEAAQALGRIGVDPEGAALRAFVNTLFPPVSLKDEQVLTAIAGATGALCRFSGPPLSKTGTSILTILAARDRPPVARARAERELRTLH